MKLTTVEETKSTVASVTLTESDNLVYSSYYLKMELTQDQLRQMAQHKVTDMKFPDLHGGSRSFTDKELRNRFQKFMIEGAKCMLGQSK